MPEYFIALPPADYTIALRCISIGIEITLQNTVVSLCRMRWKMERPGYYTVGLWFAREGNEAAVADTWKKYSEMSLDHNGAREFTLLQDPTDPGHLLSCGLWENEDAMREWLKTLEFKKLIAEMGELCEDMQIIILKPLMHLTAKVPSPARA